MALIKAILPLLFLVRIIPQPTQAALYDKTRRTYGSHDVFSIKNQSGSRLHKTLQTLQHYPQNPEFLTLE